MKQKLDRERYKLLHSIENLLEGPMVFLGFVWLVIMVIEIVWGISKALEFVTLAIWAVFIIDYFLKLFLAPSKLNYIKKSWLTAVSLLIPALRVFRIFRVFRLLRGLRGVRLVRVVASLNRSMKSLGATMARRGFGYVALLTVVVTFGGAAGMLAIEQGNEGFTSYGLALWWAAMRVITAGSDFYPVTPEGRVLAFIIAIYGYAVFGYVTATLATFFIGRDAEEADAPVAGSKELAALDQKINLLIKSVNELKAGNRSS